MIEPLGGPPQNWPEAGKAIWSEIEDMVPAGVAAKADRLMFETLCRLVAEMRTGTFTPALATQVRMTCNEFGMTPASSSKVCAVRAPEENPFSKL